MHNFKELKVWNKSVELALEIYKLSGDFPREEKYGLISQIGRSAISISSNIAEGTGRRTEKDFHSFLSNALASSYELETQLIISVRLNIINSDQFNTVHRSREEIQKMIVGLQRTLKIN
jgi:four helix bundle protein